MTCDIPNPEQPVRLHPHWRQLHIPMLTPLSVYRAMANHGDDYLFQTRRHGPAGTDLLVPELSIVGLPCHERVELTESTFRVLRDGQLLSEAQDPDPLSLLQLYMRHQEVESDPRLPAFSGGLFGYFGFETTRMIEPRLSRTQRKPSALDLPDAVLLLSRDLVVFDHADGSIWAITHREEHAGNAEENLRLQCAAETRLDELSMQLYELGQLPSDPTGATEKSAHATMPQGIRRTFGQAPFQRAVRRIKEYIVAGDVMQVVLAQCTEVPMSADALTYYQALTQVSQAPYNYLLNLGTAQIIGASPETLFQHRKGRIVERPMAGTRARGNDDLEDRRLEAELLADPKENAEHMMLVDLARNDLGRIARAGSVQVDALRVVERYSHVMHMVSTVSADVESGCDGIDSLRATFPAGTVSGASKVRALEIIAELEPRSRGVYGGTVGYITWHGEADLAIAIRTAVLQAGNLHITAGAGVVLDSVPEREWRETLDKGRALMLAAGIANQWAQAAKPEGMPTPIPARDPSVIKETSACIL